MAKETSKNKLEAISDPGESGSSSELTDSKFREYIKNTLCPDFQNAKSLQKVTETVSKQKEVIQNYKTCAFIQAQKANDEYSRIANNITIQLGQSAVEIKNDIAAYIAIGDEMEKALSVAVQAIKEVKTKIGLVKDAACKLDNCIKDSCNSEQKKILDNGLPKLDPTFPADKFDKDIKEIQDQVTAASDTGRQLFESSVKVVGIEGFINLASLKPYGDNLQTEITKLTADIDGNIKFSAGEKEKAQKELTTAIQELTTAYYQQFLAQLKTTALDKTGDYLIDEIKDDQGAVTGYDVALHPPTKEDGSLIPLSDICKKVEASFGTC